MIFNVYNLIGIKFTEIIGLIIITLHTKNEHSRL